MQRTDVPCSRRMSPNPTSGTCSDSSMSLCVGTGGLHSRPRHAFPIFGLATAKGARCRGSDAAGAEARAAASDVWQPRVRVVDPVVGVRRSKEVLSGERTRVGAVIGAKRRRVAAAHASSMAEERSAQEACR